MVLLQSIEKINYKNKIKIRIKRLTAAHSDIDSTAESAKRIVGATTMADDMLIQLEPGELVWVCRRRFVSVLIVLTGLACR